MSYADKAASCRECGRQFVFTVEEQRRMAAAGVEIVVPAVCPACRRKADAGAPTPDGAGLVSDWPRVPGPTPAAPADVGAGLVPARSPAPARPDAPAERPAPVVLPGRRTGRVKWFEARKGFGFIVQDDGGEIFVHHSGIAGEGHRSLQDDQPVEYEIEVTDKGPQAVNVTPLES